VTQNATNAAQVDMVLNTATPLTPGATYQVQATATLIDPDWFLATDAHGNPIQSTDSLDGGIVTATVSFIAYTNYSGPVTGPACRCSRRRPR